MQNICGHNGCQLGVFNERQRNQKDPLNFNISGLEMTHKEETVTVLSSSSLMGSPHHSRVQGAIICYVISVLKVIDLESHGK